MVGLWRQAQDPWTPYWRDGRVASLAEGAAPSRALDPYWLEFFAELPPQSSILDLATGNGAVTRLAELVAKGRGVIFDIIGIDAAHVGKRTQPQPDNASPFLAGGIRIEALPYRHASFDAVTSQFGFEYASEIDAAREVARVLRPAGKTRLILHARDGAIFAAISARLNRLRCITVKSGLVETILYGAAARVGDDNEGEALADMTIAGQRNLLASLPQNAPPEDSALFYARGLLDLWSNRERYVPTDLHTSISDASERIKAQEKRLSAMLEAAHSLESLNILGEALSYCGVAASLPRPVTDQDGAQIAWLLDGVRRDV